MTGWRLGWIVAPPALMTDLGKLIEYNTSCSPVFVQRAGVAAIARRRADGRAHAGALSRPRATSWSTRSRACPASRSHRRPARCTRSSASKGSSDSLDFCKRAGARSAAGPRAGQRVRTRRRRLRALVLRVGARAAGRRRRTACAVPRREALRWPFACALRSPSRHRVPRAAVGVAHAADMSKTLRVAFPIAENGFDPQAVYDAYSDAVCNAIFDPLYRYDYFARPVQARAQHRRRPAADHRRRAHVHDQGEAGHLLRFRSGVQGQEARARRRGLRLQHQAHLRSEGARRTSCTCSKASSSASTSRSLARARRAAFDYDEKIEGLQALDRYTLRIRFRQPEYGFQWWLDHAAARGGRARGRRSVSAMRPIA